MKQSRKITYSAAFVALAALFLFLSRFTPLTLTLLVVPAVCFCLAYTKCGFIYGLITTGISLFLSSLYDGFIPSATFLLTAFYFAPYALLAYLMHKLTYAALWQAIVRVLVCAVFFTAMSTLLVLVFEQILSTSIGTVVENIGKPVAIAFISVFFLPFDLIFTYIIARIQKVLK